MTAVPRGTETLFTQLTIYTNVPILYDIIAQLQGMLSIAKPTRIAEAEVHLDDEKTELLSIMLSIIACNSGSMLLNQKISTKETKTQLNVSTNL